MIEIVKLDPDGNPEKEVILTDVPEKLNELLAKLKFGAYRNGRYAVYLTEYSVSGHAVIGRRLLMEVYKSGHTLGDPVHEPGPSSNPLPKESPKQEPPAAPKVPLPHTTLIMPTRVVPAVAERHDASPAATNREASSPAGAARNGTAMPAPRVSSDRAPAAAHYAAFAGYSLAAAVVAMGARGELSARESWANRVDEALGVNQVKSLRRMAWLARARRRGQQ